MDEKPIRDYTFSDFVHGFFRFVAIIFMVKLVLALFIMLLFFGGIASCVGYTGGGTYFNTRKPKPAITPTPIPTPTPRKRR